MKKKHKKMLALYCTICFEIKVNTIVAKELSRWNIADKASQFMGEVWDTYTFELFRLKIRNKSK